MNMKKFSEAMSEVNDKYYEEAANYQPKRKRQQWVKWGAIAACLCLVVAGIFTIGRSPASQMPDFIDKLNTNGISADCIENPFLISFDEEPKMQKEDFKNILANNIVIWGVVHDCSYFHIETNDADWYITTMSVDINNVIHGDVNISTINIVSADCYSNVDMGEEFPVRRGLTDCVPGTEGVFVISKVTDDSTWNIGDEIVSVGEFGNYIYRMRCSLQNNSIIYEDFVLSINEVQE